MFRRLVSLAAAAAAVTALAAASASASPPRVHVFPAPADATSSPFGVTAGPGGLWYADGQYLVVIHRDGRSTDYTVADPAAANVGWLTRDAGRVWFADRGTGRLGTITANGRIHEVQIPPGADGTAAVPQAIVVVHHTVVWFTDQDNNRIGRYSTTTGRFAFYAVPSQGPLGMVRGGDGDLYFTERSVDKVARFDPRTGLFTEWTLPTGAFANRLAVAPDGTVWFTSLLISALWHIDRSGHLREHPITGGPVGITFWHRHIWVALFASGQVGEVSLRGALQRTWTLPDAANAEPLQIAAGYGRLWTTGSSAVYTVRP